MRKFKKWIVELNNRVRGMMRDETDKVNRCQIMKESISHTERDFYPEGKTKALKCSKQRF